MCEVDIHAGPHHFHAHETSEDMYTTIDKVVDKLERQIRAKKDENLKKGANRASDHLIFDESGGFTREIIAFLERVRFHDF